MTGAAASSPSSAADPAPPEPSSGARGLGFSIAHMDRSADPRVDFYRYATGAWTDRNPIPADKTRWSAFDALREANFALLRGLVERASARTRGSETTSPSGQVGRLYRGATDRAHRDALGLGPIARDLAAIRRIRSGEALRAAIASFHRRGVFPCFDQGVGADLENSGVYALYLVQGGLSLPDRDYYLSSSFAGIRTAYRAHLARIARRLGEPADRARTQSATIVRIETALARASKSRTDLRDPRTNYHRFTLAELERRYPRIGWRAHLRRSGAGRPAYVVVGQPEFFDTVDRLLGEVALSDWKVYLRWQLFHAAAPHLTSATDREDFEFFHRTLLGQEEPEPDWKRATAIVDGEIGEALGRLYVRRYFPAAARDRMRELVADLRGVFADRLRRVAWMTEATRARASEKFDRFTAKIGSPARFRSYARLRLAPGDHWGNVQRAEAFEIARKNSRIGGRVDRHEWEMTPPTVNAYFQGTLNEIVFPAGILQPPFFDPAQDDAVNLGGIGVVIGHEITHGYDDQGRKFDADGNLRDWWSPRDEQEFNARAQKIIEEFNAFEVLPGTRINGALTAGENIADLGGLSIAFEALERRLADGRTPAHPIDGFSPQQRFFLSYAQIWRSNVRDAEARRRVTIDPHAPGRFRVNGPLANLPAFWEAFAVPPGAPMRRSEGERVDIW